MGESAVCRSNFAVGEGTDDDDDEEAIGKRSLHCHAAPNRIIFFIELSFFWVPVLSVKRNGTLESEFP